MKYKKYWRKTSLKQKNVGDFFLKEISLSKPKNFLEIGIFQGVSARNICELLYKIHKDDFNYNHAQNEAIDYLNFNVAKPINAKIIDIIQNLITTVDSAQPFFSK